MVNKCFLCEEAEETIDGLLIRCSKARWLWDLLFAIIGVSLVFPRCVRETLLSWCDLFLGKRCKISLFFFFIFWTIWRERNKIAFDSIDISDHRMKSSLLYNFWSSVNLYIIDRPNSLVYFFFYFFYNLFGLFSMRVDGYTCR